MHRSQRKLSRRAVFMGATRGLTSLFVLALAVSSTFAAPSGPNIARGKPYVFWVPARFYVTAL